jgi:hypothetical protein
MREIKIRAGQRITEHTVCSAEEALLYLTDCTLATVEHMAGLKSKTRHEYMRQIGIAQKAVDWIYAMDIAVDKGERIEQILSGPYYKSVLLWCEKFEPKTIEP